jgi:hypothetical protein
LLTDYPTRIKMAPKKNNQPSVRAAIKTAGSNSNISKRELQQISKQTNAPVDRIIRQLDKVNASSNKAPIGLGAAAFNTLLKTPTSRPIMGQSPSSLGLSDPYNNYGTGGIGQAIMQGKGSNRISQNTEAGGTLSQYNAGTGRVPMGQQVFGSYNGAPQLQIKPQATANAGGAGPYNGVFDDAFAAAQAGQNTGADGGAGAGAGDQFDYQSLLDAIAGIQQPEFDMSALTDMFNAQFDELSSKFDSMDPLQLAQIGRNYGGDAIRARQRMRKTTRDYRRGLPAMALGQSLANLAIGGGLTL